MILSIKQSQTSVKPTGFEKQAENWYVAKSFSSFFLTLQ